MGNGETVRVLVVCIHNSARSQMAETYLNAMGHGKVEAESAGLEPGKLNPIVVRAMQEDGYDISGNTTKSVFDFRKEGRRYDYVIAVCDKEAEERCPIFPGAGKRLHWPFGDPSSFQGTEEEKLAYTRKIRDEIKEGVQLFLSRL